MVVAERPRCRRMPLDGSQKVRLINMRLALEEKQHSRHPEQFLLRCRSTGGLLDKLRGSQRRALHYWFGFEYPYESTLHYFFGTTDSVPVDGFRVGTAGWIAQQKESAVTDLPAAGGDLRVLSHSDFFQSEALTDTHAEAS